MATDLSINPELIQRALDVSGERTKEATVSKVLQEAAAHRQQERLLDLIGKLEWDDAYDYKAERERNSASLLTPASRRSREQARS